MTKCRGFTAASFLALSLVATLPRTTAAADRAQLRVGASKVDITPSDLTGLTNMWRTPLEKVRHWIETQPEFNRAFLPYLGRTIRALEGVRGPCAV